MCKSRFINGKGYPTVRCPLLGWIANRINPLLSHYAEIVDLLVEHIDAPLLGKIPYLHKPEEQELGHYLTNIDRLMYMQTELVK